MNIRQIQPTRVFPKDIHGKWCCSDWQMGSDKHYVHRYLKLDGTWGKTTDYFDTKEQLDAALKLGHKPDFNMDRQELQDRATIRDDMEAMSRDDDDSDF